MKTLKYMLIAACAIMALAACSDDDSASVSNPKMQFCAVGDTTTAVSQLTFTKWSSFQYEDINIYAISSRCHPGTGCLQQRR